jgi:hypothetical protein
MSTERIWARLNGWMDLVAGGIFYDESAYSLWALTACGM